MSDSIAILPPGWRALDDSGNLVPGARLNFYAAGTTTPRAVYSDSSLSTSLGSLITCDAYGYPTSDGSTRVSLYTGTTAYKLAISDADGVNIVTHDNLRGATASPASSSTATPTFTTVSKTADFTIAAPDDRGTLYQCVCTGGAIVATLPSAITAGAGWCVALEHDGSANTLTVKTVSGQTVTYRGKARTSVVLRGRGEALYLVSNGANWMLLASGSNQFSDAPPVVSVVYRTNTPPVSPSAGARYIVTTSPTGAWSAYTPGNIAESDGNGAWLEIVPPDGMLAWSDGDLAYYKYKGGWTVQDGMQRPTALTIPFAVFADQKASGSGGGSGTAGAWTTSTINTTLSNTITGASLASNKITLPKGSYRAEFWRTFYNTKMTQMRLRSTTDAAKTYPSNQAYVTEDGSAGGGTYHQSGMTLVGAANVIVTADSEEFDLQYYIEQTFADALGKAASRGVAETYAIITVQALSVTATWP